MVRLVLRPYTQVWRAICTSIPLRASIRVPLIIRLHRAFRNIRTFESTLLANRRVRLNLHKASRTFRTFCESMILNRQVFLWNYIVLSETSGRSKNYVCKSLNFCLYVNSASRNSILERSKNRCGQIVEHELWENDVCISSSDFVKLYSSEI